MAEKNLVLGSGRGFSWYVWEPFVRSFVRYFQNTDLVLFVEDLSDFTRYQLETVGKEIKGGELKLVSFPEELKSRHPANARWKMFSDYVNAQFSEYVQIFISDTRDLFFQGNIFECFRDQCNYLAFAVEDFAGSLGYYRGTKFDWLYKEIIEIHGKEEADALADKFNISPIIAGTSVEMKNFLQKMWDFMPDSADFYTLDGVTLWHIFYNKLINTENIIEVRCHSGSMMSADWYFKLNPIEIKDDFVLNGEGKIPAVIHQFDRHEILAKLVDKCYRKKNYLPVENFTDEKSNAEQMLNLVQNEDLENSLNFFMGYFWNKDVPSNLANELIDCWKILLARKDFDQASEILNTALQKTIMYSLKENVYLNHCRRIYECMSICKNKKLTIVEGFESWVKSCSLNVIKWHLEHSNAPRYKDSWQLMVDMNLTDNEYFYFLKAELCRDLGQREEAAEYYEQALKCQCKDKTEIQKSIAEYWKKLIKESKVFTVRYPKVIKPTTGANDKGLIFDEYKNSFVIVRK